MTKRQQSDHKNMYATYEAYYITHSCHWNGNVILRKCGIGCSRNCHFDNFRQSQSKITIQCPVNWTIVVVRGWMLDGCSRESVKVFETENVSTWGGLEPPTSGFMPNALTIWAIRARHLLSHVFEYWLWWYRYFGSNVNIWNVNCARATAFIFDTRADVPVKVSKLFDMV